MFIDRAKIYVASGAGGDGVVSFRREKHVPRGGPDGGDGGRGGSVYLAGPYGLNTLVGFRYRPRYPAPDGKPGAKQRRTGASGEDLVVFCPVGTQAYRLPEKALTADLDEDGKRVLVARGGRGGKGNGPFATSPRPPRGPHLGVVELDRERAFVMADIPGLIAGASGGAGLGHDFLRHIERTRMVAVVVDAAGSEGRDPVGDLTVVLGELETHSPELAAKVALVIANKIDLPGATVHVQRLREATGLPVLPLSASSGAGCDDLVGILARELEARRLWTVGLPTSDDEPFDPLA